MTNKLERSFTTDLEIERGGDGRTIIGLAVPFDKPTPVLHFDGTPYLESFKRGSFTKTIQQRGDKVKLLRSHDRRQLPLGRATKLQESKEGLIAHLYVSETRDGDEILTLVRDGSVDALSIGAMPVRPGPNHRISAGDHVERSQVALFEISLVAIGAYDDARVLALRGDGLVSDTPRLDAWRKLLNL